MTRQGTYKNKTVYEKYGRNDTNVETGAGPLRPREILKESYGICQGKCHSKKYRGKKKERLFGGLCDWCRWIENDTEAGEG